MTKGELIRYVAIDRCLRDTTRQYSIQELAKECVKDLNEYYPERNFCEGRISDRQVFKDLAFMRKSPEGWRLDDQKMIIKPRYDERSVNENGRVIEDNFARARAYRYRDPEFSITKMPLVEGEIPWLQEFHFLADYFKDKPDFGWITEMAIKLDDARAEGMNIIVPEIRHEITLKGFNEYFYKLFNAIQMKRVMRIAYKTYGGKEETFVISPYFLKEYNNRWFLFGYNHARKEITNAPIDRIEGVEPTDDNYVSHTEVEELRDLELFDDYFDNVIGVSRDKGKKEEVVKLRFSAKRYPMVKTKPIHPNQRNRDDERTVILHVIPNNELYQTILSFGKDVEVIEPLEVREEVRRIIREMAANYEQP